MFSEYDFGVDGFTSNPMREVVASNLLAAGSEVTLTARLPSLVILWDRIFSCAIPSTSFASEFGFTFQNEDSLEVVGNIIGIPVYLFFL